jgi:hypothetical protein
MSRVYPDELRKEVANELCGGGTDTFSLDWLEALEFADKIIEMVMENELKCEWSYDEVDDMYSTECKKSFQFTHDGIAENSFVFCPYCGGRITTGDSDAH